MSGDFLSLFEALRNTLKILVRSASVGRSGTPRMPLSASANGPEERATCESLPRKEETGADAYIAAYLAAA